MDFCQAKLHRSSFKIFRDVIHALLHREIKTRFGNSRLGYFWALAEPIAQALCMGLIFSLMGRNSVANIPVALFLFVGILPFKFVFNKLLTQLAAAIIANKGLLTYRQVHPLDPIITRIIIELAIFLLSYLFIFLCMSWLGFYIIPDDFLALLTATFLLAIFSIGLGLLCCVATSYFADTRNIISMLSLPLFMISGIFFAATSIPQQYWYLFSWNPIFHAIELSRDAFFQAYTTPIGSWTYLGLVAGSSFSLGLAVFFQNRQRFVTL